MTICAIHQPNFFPWAGYFDKIRLADTFIFLDEVAYPKSGSGSGSWCNRVRLLNVGQPAWYGLPVQRISGTQMIKHVEFSNKAHFTKKLKKSIETNYSKTKCFKQGYPLIESLLDFSTTNLAEFNINAITELSRFLGLKTNFIKQSDLKYTGQSTELLINLVQQVEADTYLCGNGATGYQDDSLFKDAGINLIYQNNNPANTFIPNLHEIEYGLSILHLILMHYDDLNFK